MGLTQEKVLILTVRMDASAQQYFDGLRSQHFPVERNFLKAHLTLFHQLPDTLDTVKVLSELSFCPFAMQVTRLINLGAGVAFRLEGAQLGQLRAVLVQGFSGQLTAQDKKGFRGHVTVQNKTSPEIAGSLLARLSADFTPFEVHALGLDLWYYLGGPWAHKQFFPFDDLPSAIAKKILAVARQRGAEKSTCPSEIARMMFPDDWRRHMKEVVDVAIELHHGNKVTITQKGMPIAIDHIKGPIRIKII